jgi:lysozyme family protein
MTNYEDFVPFILRWEGGVSNHVADRGGLTNRGITKSTFNALSMLVGLGEPTDDRFYNMTEEDAKAFIKYFWNKATANNKIKSQKVAEAMTSWLWGSGIRGGAKKLQRFWNEEFGVAGTLFVDGIIGSRTAKAFNNVKDDMMFERLCAHREKFFNKLVEKNPSQKVFLKGWTNRLNDLRDRWN